MLTPYFLLPTPWLCFPPDEAQAEQVVSKIGVGFENGGVILVVANFFKGEQGFLGLKVEHGGQFSRGMQGYNFAQVVGEMLLAELG